MITSNYIRCSHFNQTLKRTNLLTVKFFFGKLNGCNIGSSDEEFNNLTGWTGDNHRNRLDITSVDVIWWFSLKYVLYNNKIFQILFQVYCDIKLQAWTWNFTYISYIRMNKYATIKPWTQSIESIFEHFCIFIGSCFTNSTQPNETERFGAD